MLLLFNLHMSEFNEGGQLKLEINYTEIVAELNLAIMTLKWENNQLKDENNLLKEENLQLKLKYLTQDGARSPTTPLQDISHHFKRMQSRQVTRLFSQKFLDIESCRSQESSQSIPIASPGYRPRGSNSQSILRNIHDTSNLSKYKDVTLKVGAKLFQNFFIIAPDRSELFNQDKLVITVKAKIVSSYPFHSLEKYDILPHHIFSNGVQVKKLLIEKHQLQLKESEIYQTILKTSASQKSDNEFIFTMKEAQDYSMSDNINPILKEANPNLFQYCICFQFEDFYYNDKGDEGIEIWMCPVVFCFMTYYPFIGFFQEVNAQIRNMLKTIRCSEISIIDTNTKIFEVDLEYSMTQLNRSLEITRFLSSLQYQEPNVGQEFIFQQDKLTLLTPSLIDACYLETDWCASIAFTHLSAAQFCFLFTALMLEQHVTLFSVNQCLLSATMLTLINLFRPFKYPFPICFALPCDSLSTMELILPFFFGIKGNYFQFKEEIEQMENEDTIYIDLDTSEIFYSFKQTYLDLSKYTPDMPKVVSAYRKINPSMESAFQSFSMTKSDSYQTSPRYSKRKSLQSQPERTLYRNVICGFHDFMIATIINYIPTEALYNKSSHPDVLRITAKMKTNKKMGSFAIKFIETQAFSCYLDENYDKIVGK